MTEAKINVDALHNIDLRNGEPLSPAQILKLMDQAGSHFYSSSPKPICVIKVDMRYFEPEVRTVGELWREMIERMPDYHVFLMPNDDRERHIDVMELQVFHPKDFTDIQFQELKDMILTDLEGMKPQKNEKS